MSSKSVLQGEISVWEGSVLEVHEEVVWVKDKNGRQISISFDDSSGRFRVGHRVKIAALTTDNGYALVKGINLTTGETIYAIREMQEKLDAAGFIGLIRTGFGTMLAVNVRLTMALIIPLLNGLVAIFFVIAALGLANESQNPVRVFFTTLLVGTCALCAYVLFCAISPSLYLFGLLAPAVGVIAGYCYLGRTLARQFNRAIDKVNQRFELVDRQSAA